MGTFAFRYMYYFSMHHYLQSGKTKQKYMLKMRNLPVSAGEVNISCQSYMYFSVMLMKTKSSNDNACLLKKKMVKLLIRRALL